MKSLLEQIKFEQMRVEIANGLFKPIMTQVKQPNNASAWEALSVLMAKLLLQHRDSKKGFEPLKPEKIKGRWPKGYVIKKRDLS